jgi:hypothetical protein
VKLLVIELLSGPGHRGGHHGALVLHPHAHSGVLMIRLFTEVAYETTREAAMAAFAKSWRRE